MMWIVASLPLWFLGVLLSAMGIIAVIRVGLSPGKVTDYHARMTVMAFACLVFGSGFLYLAAKVAS